MVTAGDVDEKAFSIGESVILAIPLYEEGEAKNNIKEQTGNVKDDEMFSYVLEKYVGYTLSYDHADSGRMQRDSSIAPGEKSFPFFADENGFLVFGSPLFLKKLSIKATGNPMEYYTKEQFDFVLTQCPTSFGETYLNVYTDDKANAAESATKVMKYGKSCDMDFINYNEENWNLYYKALNTALLLGVFGVATGILTPYYGVGIRCIV